MDGSGWERVHDLELELGRWVADHGILRAYFVELTIFAVGLANTIAPETATTAQQHAVRLLERFLSQIPPELRAGRE